MSVVKKGPAKRHKRGQGSSESQHVSSSVWAALRAERQGGYSQPAYPQRERPNASHYLGSQDRHKG
jgi:hypothetical protein